MACPNLIMSGSYNGRWRATSGEIREFLGLRRGDKLPADGMQPRLIQGTWVYVRAQQPLKPGQRKRSTHRVYAECRGCRKWVPTGRMHQHVCR